jgi:hypothetical protein
VNKQIETFGFRLSLIFEQSNSFNSIRNVTSHDSWCSKKWGAIWIRMTTMKDCVSDIWGFCECHRHEMENWSLKPCVSIDNNLTGRLQRDMVLQHERTTKYLILNTNSIMLQIIANE